MKRLALAILLQLTLIACASFGYKYYGLEMADGCYKDGKLLGHAVNGNDDLPLTLCEPDALSKGKCAIMLTDEFDRMKAAFITCQDELKACQQGH